MKAKWFVWFVRKRASALPPVMPSYFGEMNAKWFEMEGSRLYGNSAGMAWSDRDVGIDEVLVAVFGLTSVWRLNLAIVQFSPIGQFLPYLFGAHFAAVHSNYLRK